MTGGASVEGRERVRLFCALRLPEDALDAVVEWQRLHVLRGRVVPRENLHFTLAFLGWTPADAVPAIAGALREAAAGAGPLAFEPVRYRETGSVGMVVFRDDGERGAELALDLARRLEELDVYEPEQRPWLPHLTVVRFGTRPRLRPPVEGLPAFSPSDAALYNSLLRSTGAQYVVLESVALRH